MNQLLTLHRDSLKTLSPSLLNMQLTHLFLIFSILYYKSKSSGVFKQSGIKILAESEIK